MNKKGVTLIEILVAVALFSITVGAILGLFISGIQTQRRILVTRELLDQTSYVLEYMGRYLRMAKKDLTGKCLGTAGTNYKIFYDVLNNPSIIRFLNYQGFCQQFRLEGNEIKVLQSSDATEANLVPVAPLTSASLRINSLKFYLSGDAPGDILQPMVTIFLEIQGGGIAATQPKIQIQTSISQRNLNTQQ
jgi:prepilin-type N-terminal cleavage/methylation domain-containing protein